MSIAITLHLLAAVIWVGGMFFAYMALRPSASELLEPPVRLALWVGVLSRFFPWVGGAIAVLIATGLWMIVAVMGGMGQVGPHVHLMLALATIMILMFFHTYFAPFKRLKLAVKAEEWEAGASKLNQIRVLIGANLVIGLVVVVVGSAGRYWVF